MYSPDRFVEYANEHFKSKVKPAVLKETAQELRAVETEKSAEMGRTSDELMKSIAAIKPISVEPIKPLELHFSDELMKSIGATLGIFLLLASRNPSAHRSLIALHGVVESRSRRHYGAAGTP